MQQRVAGAVAAYQRLGWQFPASIDRIYSIAKAQRVLGYQPHYTFGQLLADALRAVDN